MCRKVQQSSRLSRFDIILFSLDDFYYSFEEQQKKIGLHEGHPNELLRGRGPPGTHDLNLFFNILSQLETSRLQSQLSEYPSSTRFTVPRYDKLLNQGKGDRYYETIEVNARKPWIIMLEGWFVGMAPTVTSSLLSDTNLREINTFLQGYQKIWAKFQLFITIEIPDLRWIYNWRWEQETSSSLKTNTKGLSKDQVNVLVARCLPIYENFGGAHYKNPTLRIILDETRAISELK